MLRYIKSANMSLKTLSRGHEQWLYRNGVFHGMDDQNALKLLDIS
jgi:hypothetical protein